MKIIKDMLCQISEQIKSYFITDSELENIYHLNNTTVIRIYERSNSFIYLFMYVVVGYLFFNNIPISNVLLISSWKNLIPWTKQLYAVLIHLFDFNSLLHFYVLLLIFLFVYLILNFLFPYQKYCIMVKPFENTSDFQKLLKLHKVSKVKDNNFFIIKTRKRLLPKTYLKQRQIHAELFDDEDLGDVINN